LTTEEDEDMHHTPDSPSPTVSTDDGNMDTDEEEDLLACHGMS